MASIPIAYIYLAFIHRACAGIAMCGILCILTLRAAASLLSSCQEVRKVLPAIRKRGPDSQGLIEDKFTDEQGHEWGGILMHSAVLHLRGVQRCDQPVRDAHGNTLCWNGEVFGGELVVEHEESDTPAVLRALVACVEDQKQTGGSDVEAIMDTLQKIEGPFAFIFWHASTRRLWYGRDRLGRRSLLVRKPPQGEPDVTCALSSCVGHADALRDIRDSGAVWEEVPPMGIYCVHVDGLGGGASLKREVVRLCVCV
jgi:asparagine synthetase B (glutamine-hydrolysing)